MLFTLPQRRHAKYLKLIAGVFVLASLVYVGAGLIRVDAATAALVPNSVTSSTWTGSYTAIDEGTTTTSDYINSGSTAGVSGQFGMSDLGNVSSASSISVNVCAYSATNANGGILDTLTVNVLINGVAQTAQTITPAYSASSICTLYNPIVLSGTYTSADINSLQITLATTVKGSGNPTGQIDDVRVANAYMSITYTQATVLAQANYRWFANADSTTPGSPLAAQDTAAAVPAGTVARLRQRVAVDNGALSQSANNYKLQYAPKVGTCDVGFSGETYTDVNGPLGDSARQPITAVNDSSYGTTAWTNPTGGITSGDSSFAEIISPSVAGSTNSQYLKLSNFGFSIPTDATILGVKATFTIQTNSISGTANRRAVQIVKGGIATGTAKGSVTWRSTDSTDTVGNSSDLWGTTLTPADVNASDFGVAIAADVQYDDFGGFATYADIDGVTLDVYYTAPPSPLQYFDNTTPADATTIASSGNDPVNGARPTVYQSYRETNPFTNNVGSIAAGSDGMWDFSLKLSSSATGSYCVRVVKADGSLLNTYNSVAEVAVLPPSLTQANYRWFANADSATPGSPLATQDTVATVTPDTAVRLRQRLAVDTAGLSQSANNYKLQYAPKVGTCDIGFSGETYMDVNNTSANSAESSISGTSNDASTGTVAWASANEAGNAAGDGFWASVTAPTNNGIYYSNWVKSQNHGFSIPVNATVTGIKVGYVAENSSIDGGVYIDQVRLVKAGTIESTGKTPNTFVDATFTTYEYGSENDMWGTSWTPTDINSGSFGTAMSMQLAPFQSYTSADVDNLYVIVYYTLPGTSGPIAYYDNSSASDSIAISSTGNDSTNGARPTVYQSYRETDPFTNNISSIAAGSDGMWDLSLKTAAAADGQTFCFRVVQSDGNLLDSYVQIPELTVSSGGGGPTLDQQLRGGQYVIGGTKGKFTW